MSDSDDRPSGGTGQAIAKRAASKAAKHGARKVLIALGIKGGFWVGLVVLILLVIAAAAGAASHSPASASSLSCGGVAGVAVKVTGVPNGLTPEQISNAQAIAGVALGLGLGEKDVQIGIVAAITESTLQNLNYGDFNSSGQMTTSRGMFQMMDAWGPLADRLDPTKAATLFYTVDKGPGVRGLIHIPGWEQMTVTQAAQAVEGSQFSDGSNYASNLPQAVAITTALLAGQPIATAGPAAACAAHSTGVNGAVYSPPGLTQNDSQDPSTFGWVHAGPMEPLVWQGHSFGQVAAGTVKLWTAMLNELVPLIPGGLTSDLGCFEDRSNVNNPSALSFHAYGLACDINSGDNPNGAPGYGRTGQHVIPGQAAHDIAGRFCMEYGGDFRGVQDPMHLEVHCTPQQVAAWSATQP